jgi:hypothetical protein
MCILRERYNKIIASRWFDEYWGENYNAEVVAQLGIERERAIWTCCCSCPNTAEHSPIFAFAPWEI